VHSTEDSVAASVEMRVFGQVKQLAMFDLEPSPRQIEERPKSEGFACIKQRDLGVLDELENVRSSSQESLNWDRIVLSPSQLKHLVNQAGLGNVLNERQLLRYRKETPHMESADGGIHLIRLVALLCLRKTKGRMASHQTKLKLSGLYELLEEQNYRCALTGNVLSPDDVALENIVPISSGGDFSAANSQPVSKAANRAKHTLSQSDFILLCNQVVENQRVPDESDN
jgi:hypothetical protein